MIESELEAVGYYRNYLVGARDRKELEEYMPDLLSREEGISVIDGVDRVLPADLPDDIKRTIKLPLEPGVQHVSGRVLYGE